MTHDEAFLQAIRETPSDDAPRLIYADWLEEHGRTERAEFIRLQCRLASLPQADEGRGVLEDRVEELLRRNWEEWVGPLREIAGPKYDRYNEGWLRRAYHPEGLRRFRRGFVDAITLDAERFLSYAEKLASLVPLRQLDLWGAGRCAHALADTPRLAKLKILAFSDYWDAPLRGQDVPALAASAHLGGLTALFLGMNSLGDEGVEALVQARWLASLNTLDLTENGLSERAISALADCPHLLHLRDLSLERNSLGDAGAERLAQWPGLANLRTLNLTSNEITDRGVRALAESPWATRRTSLYLDDNPISTGLLATLFREKTGISERRG
jgi:uncharacterized protein (TIGR02996 family)